ncbi:hypothetical protein KBC79_00090 [Candidatus Woesebacteria bacterium]|nr:hypothetical protein [Candidatus Woesebacteria bacterium]
MFNNIEGFLSRVLNALGAELAEKNQKQSREHKRESEEEPKIDLSYENFVVTRTQIIEYLENCFESDNLSDYLFAARTFEIVRNKEKMYQIWLSGGGFTVESVLKWLRQTANWEKEADVITHTFHTQRQTFEQQQRKGNHLLLVTTDQYGEGSNSPHRVLLLRSNHSQLEHKEIKNGIFDRLRLALEAALPLPEQQKLDITIGEKTLPIDDFQVLYFTPSPGCGEKAFGWLATEKNGYHCVYPLDNKKVQTKNLMKTLNYNAYVTESGEKRQTGWHRSGASKEGQLLWLYAACIGWYYPDEAAIEIPLRFLEIPIRVLK